MVADCTTTIGFAKHGLVVDDAINFVGRLEIVPLSDLAMAASPANDLVAATHSLRGLLPRRKFSVYKNEFGRIGIVAGSPGFVGAALMTTEGALRAGAGLVELFVPRDIYSIVASAAPAEAMVKGFVLTGISSRRKSMSGRSARDWEKSEAKDIFKIIERATAPMVLDADGLNIASDDVEMLKRCAGPRLADPASG